MFDLEAQFKQAEFGELVGISQPAVSDLLARGVLADGQSGGAWLKQYCRHLREIAAGRATNGDLDLATERARLAKEQADRIAMQNAIARGELAPVAAMEAVLATVGAKVGKILDTIPGLVRRRVPDIGADVVEHIASDIAKCRNKAASMTLTSLEDDDEGDQQDPADMQEVVDA
jgi:phage terminase Nu1 subunit (DNA packaging protein)